MSTTTQLRGARAREAILGAAREQFLAVGFRRASIESIAGAAGVSRPTVYAHFASKEDVFRAIVGGLHDDQFAAMQAAARRDGPIAERLYAALAARFVAFVTLAASSAHGAELLDENSRVCGDLTQRSRRRSTRLLEELLAEADAGDELDLTVAGLSPATAATVLYDAARGAKEDASTSARGYRRQLRRIVDVITRGLGSGG